MDADQEKGEGLFQCFREVQRERARGQEGVTKGGAAAYLSSSLLIVDSSFSTMRQLVGDSPSL